MTDKKVDGPAETVVSVAVRFGFKSHIARISTFAKARSSNPGPFHPPGGKTIIGEFSSTKQYPPVLLFVTGMGRNHSWLGGIEEEEKD